MDKSNQVLDTQLLHKDTQVPAGHVKYGIEVDRAVKIIAAYTFAWVLGLALLAAYVEAQDPYLYSITTYLILLGCSGGIGGALNSILGFTSHYKDGDFDENFKWWYYFRPIVGVILGIFVFYFVVGGLMILTNVSVDSNIREFRSVMFYCALAFLVGYSSTSFLRKLDDVSSAIFTEVQQNRNNGNTQTGTTTGPADKPADPEKIK